MKKIIIFIVLCFIFSVNTYGKTYYGNYSLSNESDIIKVDYRKLYNTSSNTYEELSNKSILNDYIYSYFLYSRDKLVLSDEYIIDSYNMSPYNFIKYSTNTVLVDCNINYYINGEYNCVYKLNDIIVNKKIVIDIKYNNIFFKYFYLFILIFIFLYKIIKKFCRKCFKLSNNILYLF